MWITAVINAVASLGSAGVQYASVNKQGKYQSQMQSDALQHDLILAGLGAEAQQAEAENTRENLVIGAAIIVTLIIIGVVGFVVVRKMAR